MRRSTTASCRANRLIEGRQAPVVARCWISGDTTVAASKAMHGTYLHQEAPLTD